MKQGGVVPSFLGVLVIALGVALLYLGIKGWGMPSEFPELEIPWSGGGSAGGGGGGGGSGGAG